MKNAKVYNDRTLCVALQKGERMLKPTADLLNKTGYDIDLSSRKLVQERGGIKFVICRGDDIISLFRSYRINCAIMGRNVFEETLGFEKFGHNFRCGYNASPLGYSKCALYLASPVENPKYADDLTSDDVIATPFPKIVEKYLWSNGKYNTKEVLWMGDAKDDGKLRIIKMSGGTEAAPKAGLATAIVDMVESGRTLEENGLVATDKIMDSEAVFVTYKVIYTWEKYLEEKKDMIDGLLARILENVGR
jgi:ATP phosphoribosyltransferase